MGELHHYMLELGRLAFMEQMPEEAACTAEAAVRVAEAMGGIGTRNQRVLRTGLERLRELYPQSRFLDVAGRVFLVAGGLLALKSIFDRISLGILSSERAVGEQPLPEALHYVVEQYGDFVFRAMPEYLSLKTGIPPDVIAFYILIGEVWLVLGSIWLGGVLYQKRKRVYK